MGRRQRYVLSGTRCSGRHLRVRGMHPHQAAGRHRIAAHRQMAPRAIPGDRPELPQRWRRIFVGSTSRGRDPRHREVIRPPGNPWRQSITTSGESRRSQPPDLDASANALAGTSRPAPTRPPRAGTDTARQVGSAIVGHTRASLIRLPCIRRRKFRIRARPLVPKGKLWNQKRSFPISGAVSSTKTRRQNLL
jgi:hypothetical protein